MRTGAVLVLMLTLQFSATALAATPAQPQTTYCGENMVTLKELIETKFIEVFGTGYARKFIGHWSGYTEFDISSRDEFEIRGEPYKICPQTDGSFFIFQKSDASQNGYFRLHPNAKSAKLYNASGMVAWAMGEYSHQVGVVDDESELK